MSLEIAQYARNYEQMVGREIRYGTGAGELVCNQFVIAVLRATVAPNFPMIVANDFLHSPLFRRVDSAAAGDLIHWHGHIGIVLDPDHGIFIGSQTSTGVDQASYKRGYWSNSRGSITFLRYG